MCLSPMLRVRRRSSESFSILLDPDDLYSPVLSHMFFPESPSS